MHDKTLFADKRDYCWQVEDHSIKKQHVTLFTGLVHGWSLWKVAKAVVVLLLLFLVRRLVSNCSTSSNNFWYMQQAKRGVPTS